jgi:hypothetical protein
VVSDILTKVINKKLSAMKSVLTFCTLMIGTFWIVNPAEAAISPDPTFGMNGALEIRLDGEASHPQIFKFHLDPRGNIWAIGYVR